MPPSLEVMMNHHHHHDEHHHHHHHHHDTSHDLMNSVLPGDFDDRLIQSSAQNAVDDDGDDFNDETETSEGDDQNDSPTEARMVNGEDWNHITKPGLHDVLLGRGGGTNNHSGNIKFRKLVNEHKMRYLACSKVEKPKVARQVVILWRKLDPPGRFLSRKDESKRGPGSVKATDNVWFEVGDKKAREKASQCLRERTPDVLPYIKHLREQQNAITEQGVSMVQMQMQMQMQQRDQHQQQKQQQQQVHLSPQRNPNANVVSMNMMHNMSSPSGNMHQPHPTSPYNNQGYDGPMSSAPRRNSVNPILSNSNPSNGHFSPSHQQHNNFHQQNQYQNQRRTSLPNMNVANIGAPMFDNMGGFDAQLHPDELHGGDFAEMSDMEYQQQMILMQQQMMQQQLHMQRLQQTRAMRQAAAAAATGHEGGNQMGNNNYHSPVRSSNVQLHGVQQGPIMGSGSPMHNNIPQQSAMYESTQPPFNPAMKPTNQYPTEANVVGTTSTKPKRGREEGKTLPDRTTSLMSLTPAYPDDHELSLEDYRQQLEEYVANCNKDDTHTTSINHPLPPAYLDDGNESDLEDDWEKERERAVRQAQAHKKETQNRGVNRNASGISAMSGLSNKSGMSFVSGFSGFSDISKDMNAAAINPNSKTEREQKMHEARSVGSNISLMSELTDLSQNIDHLSIYDD